MIFTTRARYCARRRAPDELPVRNDDGDPLVAIGVAAGSRNKYEFERDYPRVSRRAALISRAARPSPAAPRR